MLWDARVGEGWKIAIVDKEWPCQSSKCSDVMNYTFDSVFNVSNWFYVYKQYKKGAEYLKLQGDLIFLGFEAYCFLKAKRSSEELKAWE